MAGDCDWRVLRARAATLEQRAAVLVAQAVHPFTRDQIALIALAARDAQSWLDEPNAAGDPQRLSLVAAGLDVQATRLEALEDLLRLHGVDPRGADY